MDEQELHIKLANESDALAVDASLMRACSSVARGLPAEAAEWDLSNLLIDGQPVQRSTVIRWLNYCYGAVHGRSYDGNPPPRHWHRTAVELFQLLAFADSIGSTQGPILDCTAQDGLMHMHILVTGLPVVQQQQQQQGQDGQQQQQQERQQQQQQQQQLKSLHIPLSRPFYRFSLSGSAEQPCKLQTSEYSAPGPAPELLCLDAKCAVIAQVAAQTEQLLYIAHKLQLNGLLQLLKDFITAASGSWGTADAGPLIPSDVLHKTVYSARVLEAAGYNEAAAEAAWVRSQLQRPLFSGPDALLSLGELHWDNIQTPSFPAQLASSFRGKRKNSPVDVKVDLSERRVRLQWESEDGSMSWNQEVPLSVSAPDME